MQNIVIIEQGVLDGLISDIKDIKKKLGSNFNDNTNKKEYYTVDEAAIATGLSKGALYQACTKLETRQAESGEKLIVKYGTTIRIPHNTLHNIILK